MVVRLSAESSPSIIAVSIARWINAKDLSDIEKDDRRRFFEQSVAYLRSLGSSTWAEFILSTDSDIYRAALWLAQTIDLVRNTHVE